MKRIAVLVIAAINQPVYVHYIKTYWTELIKYTNAHKSNIDVYLLFENGSDVGEFESLRDNIIIDQNLNFNGFYETNKASQMIPGILSKTIYAYELLQNEYDVFFRTNLSSMIHMDNFENMVESRDIIYSGAGVWTDSLRSDLILRGKVGENKSIKSIEELEAYVGNTFISGSAYFLGSVDVKRLIANKKQIRYDIIDDVSVGLMMLEYEYLPGFTIILRPNEEISVMLSKLKNRRYCHVRLQHFPVLKAQELWQELKMDKFWVP